MALSFTNQSLQSTNQSLQPHVSSSNSSSFIGPHHNPECSTCLKVNRYDVGENSSDGERHVLRLGGSIWWKIGHILLFYDLQCCTQNSSISFCFHAYRLITIHSEGFVSVLV
jgi:hypothetical protein